MGHWWQRDAEVLDVSGAGIYGFQRAERTIDGLAAALRRGRTGGRKPKLGARQIAVAHQMYKEVDAQGKNKFTLGQIAAEFGVTRPTIYRYLELTQDAS